MSHRITPVRPVFALLLLFSLFSGLGVACVHAQIAPPYESPASAAEAGSASEADGPASPQNEPAATIRGWSFSSEVDESSLRRGNEVTLDPGHPEIIVFFAETGASDGRTEFRYRLDDYDADWTVTRGRIAHYRRLTPGRYRFEVEARTHGHAWQASPTMLIIQQKPFFYQTWYAYLLVGLILAAVAMQLLHQRDQLLKGQMGIILEERNRIASECHDTLMAGFAAISWQLEATAKLFGETDVNSSPAAQSCELARSMVSHCQAEARRIIWDLRNPDAITDMLSQALGSAIGAHRLRGTVETTLDVQGEEIPVSPGAVHHLVCIGQEAVSNAIRHASASSIKVLLRFGSDSLNLTIRDNGQGFQLFDSAARAGHFGIPVMEERARKLGASLKLTSSAGLGTEVAVTVSFHKIHQPQTQQHHVVPWIGV